MRETHVPVSHYLPDYPISSAHPPIVIGNHVSFMDVFYINYKYSCGFVAKSSERSVFAFRTAGEAFGAIWVDRESEGNKNSALNMIKERVSDHLERGNPR